METTITIQKIEAKSTKTGIPMWSITTNGGRMNTFGKAIADGLSIGMSYVVEITKHNGFKNVTRIVKQSEVVQENAPQGFPVKPVMSREDQIKQKRFDSASFAISYAIRLAEAKVIEVKDINEKAKELLLLYENLLDSNLVPVQKIG